MENGLIYDEFIENPDLQKGMEYAWNLCIHTLGSLIEDIPVIGDVIKLKKEKANTLEIENIKKSIFILKNTIEEIKYKNKLDIDYISNKSSEIYFMTKSLMATIYNQADGEQIKYLSQYVGNCFNIDFSDTYVKASILNKISKYSKQHLLVLKELYSDWTLNVTPDGKYNYDNNDLGKQIERICNIDKQTIIYCANDLLKDGFLNQVITFVLASSFSPYIITDIGIKCLKMTGVIN